MALPLYLAMTAAEMSSSASIPEKFAYMACHFSPHSQGLSNLPQDLPESSVLILNDNFPCQGHSPSLVAHQLLEILDHFQCESLLLDFQRPPCPESEQMIRTIVSAVSHPMAISSGHGDLLETAIFLPPCPLHIPMDTYLSPWKGREIWLEAALCQEDIRITEAGASFIPQFPAHGLQGGFPEETLLCQYRIKPEDAAITFTLFDTPESLEQKLEQAQSLGVSRGVGLWQELRSEYHL